MKPIKRILVANRGEIAVRIMRACRELGIESVAVYSDADRTALHVRTADRALALGAAPPRESYLNIEKIIGAAQAANADAIHPGYGFLAENAAFAQAAQDAGITFIGPSPFAIRAMGDKAAARERMLASGVPVVPGFQDADDDAALTHAARKLGYPVLIKAAAGGGGKAMRVVGAESELTAALESARREAAGAFGDARLILEKYIPHARHIEFQILADKFGNTIHLFERECSIQRRHQKVIEETPSPLLDRALRERMGSAAVAAAQAVGYENAGTVEFIVDPQTRTFYFLEMNTRLQVEHPITELTTGLDLVHWQVRIAQGETIQELSEHLPRQEGHAIECRIYAEDPASGFLPAAGRILALDIPNMPGVRADAGISQGDEVTTYYDPLLVKLVAHSDTRQGAIARMENALREFVLLGVRTNTEFLRAILAHSKFRAGTATTAFIERELGDWHHELGDGRLETALIASALFDSHQARTANAVESSADDPYSPWQANGAFRVGVS